MMQPTDDGLFQRIQSSFRRQGFMEYLGAVLVKAEKGFCEIHIPYKKELGQQHGFFHAGVVSTVADNTAGYAAYSMMEPSSSILTVEFKLNLLSPADGGLLIGRAQVLKYGRTLTVTRSEVYIRRGGTEKLCAAAQATLIELKNKADTPEK